MWLVVEYAVCVLAAHQVATVHAPSPLAQLDVAQAELDLFNEKATSVQRQLEEAKSSLASTKERIKDRKQSVLALRPLVHGTQHLTW